MMSEEIKEGESPITRTEAATPRTVWALRFITWLGKQSLPGLVGKLLGDTRAKDWLIEQQAERIVKLEAMNLALLNTVLGSSGAAMVRPGVTPPVPSAHTVASGHSNRVQEWRMIEELAEDALYDGDARLERLKLDRSVRGQELYNKVMRRVDEMRAELAIPPGGTVVEMGDEEETLQ